MRWKEKENLEKGMDNLSTGERNYSYPYSLMEEDADAYVQKYVLPPLHEEPENLFAARIRVRLRSMIHHGDETDQGAVRCK